MKKVFFALAVISMAACSSPKEKALDRIEALEAKDSVFTPQHVEEMKTAYLDFAGKYPDDEQSPEFIFKAAQRCNVMAQHEEALALFQSIIDKYPKNHLSEEALFLQGYIYENNLQEYGKARMAYQLFIEKYPKSDLVEDAAYAMQNMGKSPEQIFESFNNKDSAGSDLN